MGEYAQFHGETVKIGTCADMYYLRFDDRHLVKALDGNVDPVAQAHDLRFRLPFPDEDGIGPGGNYNPYNRSLPLFKVGEWFTDPDVAEEPGIIQLTHPCGLLINVPCFHGVKLPEPPPGGKVFWNGKDPGALVLSSLRAFKDDRGNLRVAPVVRCKFCQSPWRYTWAEVFPFIADEAIRQRLKPYYDAERTKP
jgi:hypothetical protein